MSYINNYVLDPFLWLTSYQIDILFTTVPIVSVKQQQCNAMLAWVHQEKIAICKANVHTEELFKRRVSDH